VEKNIFKAISFNKGLDENGEWDTYLYTPKSILENFTFCGNYAIEGDLLVTKGAFILYDAQENIIAWFDKEGCLDEVAPATPFPNWNAFLPCRYQNKHQFYNNNKTVFEKRKIFNFTTRTQEELLEIAEKDLSYSTDFTFFLPNKKEIDLINSRLVKLPFDDDLYYLDCNVKDALYYLRKEHHVPSVRMKVFQINNVTFIISNEGEKFNISTYSGGLIEQEINNFSLLRTRSEIEAGTEWGKIQSKPEIPDEVFSDERIGWMGGKD